MSAATPKRAPKQIPEREHALLSASSSHRWLHCTPSARLEETLPEATSEYAEEGRLAHAIAELKLRKHFTPMGPKAFSNALKKLQADPRYAPEMLAHTDTYLEYIQQTCHAYDRQPHVAIERRLDYSHIAPEGFGTGDCIIIGGKTLWVVDFKYGAGVPVSAEQNPQMMLYALGALQAYGLLYDIEQVCMAIVQPRLDSISEHSMPVNELRTWGEGIRPIAQKAYEGKGEYCPGDWCRFCRAKGKCRAQAETYTATISALEAFGGARPPLITNEELGEILLRAQPIAAWLATLEECALKAILRGEPVQGWKAVEGRSNRAFRDTDEAFKQLIAAGYNEAALYTRKPLTLTEVEKLLQTKKQFDELLGQYIIKPPGKPTLVPETDKREAINLTPTAADAFTEPA